MSEEIISPNKYAEKLQTFVGKELTNFYYITDSIVVFEAGNKFLEDKNDINSNYDSEYEIRVWGGWDYSVNGKVIESSIPVESGEDIPALRKRIGDFIETIHPQYITSIKVSDDGKTSEISLNNGGKFIVHAQGDSFINFSHMEYNSNGDFVRATHLRPKEKTGELTLATAP